MSRNRFNKASELLSRRLPEAERILANTGLWPRDIQPTDCDMVLVFGDNVDVASVQWVLLRLKEQLPELGITMSPRSNNSATTSTSFTIHITATYNMLLQGLEELKICKPVKIEFGGGDKEFSRSEINIFQTEEGRIRVSASEKLTILHHCLLASVRSEADDTVGNVNIKEGDSIIGTCLSKGIISQLFPLHHHPTLTSLKRRWISKLFSPQPLGTISDYFGHKIGFYFCWLGHYTSALVFPALVGIVFWVYLSDWGFVIFSFFNCIWSTLYLTSWKRRSAELAYEWGTLGKEGELLVDNKSAQVNSSKERSVYSEEDVYSVGKRILFRYLVTYPVIALFLLIVLMSVLLMLEMQVWMDSWVGDTAALQPLTYVPKILLAITIPVLDSLYTRVATWLNKQENYESDTDFSDQLAIKLIFFQFVNSFLALFYTAFYLQDIEKLKELLAALLITRQVIGNVKESLVPYANSQYKLIRSRFNVLELLVSALKGTPSRQQSTEDFFEQIPQSETSKTSAGHDQSNGESAILGQPEEKSSEADESFSHSGQLPSEELCDEHHEDCEAVLDNLDRELCDNNLVNSKEQSDPEITELSDETSDKGIHIESVVNDLEATDPSEHIEDERLVDNEEPSHASHDEPLDADGPDDCQELSEQQQVQNMANDHLTDSIEDTDYIKPKDLDHDHGKDDDELLGQCKDDKLEANSWDQDLAEPSKNAQNQSECQTIPEHSSSGIKRKRVPQFEVEAQKPKYDGTFEDYLEMFIQFGYVTLFSAAYPLAGLFALLNNLIEIRSDAFKICFIYQRPIPEMVSNIGPWQTAMEIMGIIGVMVNCGLIGLLGPVHRIVPNMKPVHTVIIIVALEHVMLALKFLLSTMIPDTPEWISEEMERIKAKRDKAQKPIGMRSIVPCEDKGTQTEDYSNS